MSDTQQWLEANDNYLAAALAWLRLALRRMAQPEGSTSTTLALTPKQPMPKAGHGLLGRLGRKRKDLKHDETMGSVSDEQVRTARQAMEVAERLDPPPALVQLGDRFALSRFESEILLLCVAMELDTRIAALCAQAQADPARPYPSFALALGLFEEPAQAAAIKDVRNQAVSIAVAAARDVIAKKMTAADGNALIDSAIAEVDAKLH